MSLQGRISELNHKHRELDYQIDEESKRPASDDLRLQALKRKKLKIKEQLRWLKTG